MEYYNQGSRLTERGIPAIPKTTPARPYNPNGYRLPKKSRGLQLSGLGIFVFNLLGLNSRRKS